MAGGCLGESGETSSAQSFCGWERAFPQFIQMVCSGSRGGYFACLVAQAYPILWDSMDCSPPGSSVHGILQARTLEWLPFPPPGDRPKPGTEPASPALQVDSLPLSQRGSPLTHTHVYLFIS